MYCHNGISKLCVSAWDTQTHTAHSDCDAHVHSTLINKELIVGSTCQCKSREESSQGRDFTQRNFSNFIMCGYNYLWSKNNWHCTDEPTMLHHKLLNLKWTLLRTLNNHLDLALVLWGILHPGVRTFSKIFVRFRSCLLILKADQKLARWSEEEPLMNIKNFILQKHPYTL